MNILWMLLIVTITLTALATNFIKSKHPLAIIAILLAQTVVITIIIIYEAPHSLYSYALFLIFLGAMLVLFVYIGVLASNEEFQLKPTIDWLFRRIVPISITILSVITVWSLISAPIIPDNCSTLFTTEETVITTANAVWASPNSINVLFIIIFLLLTLVVAVNVTSHKAGPLQKR